MSADFSGRAGVRYCARRAWATIAGVLRSLQRLPVSAARRCAANALVHPLASPSVSYERWYLRRWHCLPEGYLSGRSVRMYDRFIRRLYSLGRELEVASVIAGICREVRARTLLDLGCGSGSLAVRIAAHAPATRVSGIDLSPYAVAEARRQAGTGLGVEIVHGDARTLSWDDGAFDVIVASHLLGHVPAEVAGRILSEAGRVLRPGGRLVLVEHRWHDIKTEDFGAIETKRVAGAISVTPFERCAT